MSEEEQLVGSPSASDIETKTESKILLDFIKANWTMDGTAVSSIDFGAHPSRTTKGRTINCYRIFSNVRDDNVGATVYAFDVPVALDVYVRDVKAAGMKDVPAPKLVAIVSYLRDFVSANRIALRDKGINNMMMTRIEYPDEPADSAWHHAVLQVRIYYHKFKVTI